MRKQISFWRVGSIRMLLLACLLTLSASAWAATINKVDYSLYQNSSSLEFSVILNTTQPATVSIYLDGTSDLLGSGMAYMTNDFTVTVKASRPALTNGSEHSIYIKINSYLSGNPYSFHIDNTAPVASDTPFTFTADHTSGTNYYFKKSDTAKSITANFTDNSNSFKGYKFKLDNGIWSSTQTSNTYNLDVSTEGVHYLYAKAIDKAGNMSNQTTYTYIVDGQCPDYIENHQPTIQANAEVGDVYWCKLNNTSCYMSIPLADKEISTGIAGSGVSIANTKLNGITGQLTEEEEDPGIPYYKFPFDTSVEVEKQGFSFVATDNVGNESVANDPTYWEFFGLSGRNYYGVDGTMPQLSGGYKFYRDQTKTPSTVYEVFESGNIHRYWFSTQQTTAYMKQELVDKDATNSWDGSGVYNKYTKLRTINSDTGGATVGSYKEDLGSEGNEKGFLLSCSKPLKENLWIWAVDKVANQGAHEMVDGSGNKVAIGFDEAFPVTSKTEFKSYISKVGDLYQTSQFTTATVNCLDVPVYPFQDKNEVWWLNGQDTEAEFQATMVDYADNSSTISGSGVSYGQDKYTYLQVDGDVSGTRNFFNLKAGSDNLYFTPLSGYCTTNGVHSSYLKTADNTGINTGIPAQPKFGFDNTAPELRTNYNHAVFAATDEHSGVYMIQYTTDGGNTWKDYVNDATSLQTLMNLSTGINDPAAYFNMRVIDHVGNTCAERTFYVKESNIIEQKGGSNIVIWAPINGDGVPAFYMAPSETDPLRIMAIDQNIYNEKPGVSDKIFAVEIPEEVILIGDSAFYGCKNIEEVLIFNETKVPEAGADAFEFNNSEKIATLYGEFDFIEPEQAGTTTYLNYTNAGHYSYNKTEVNEPEDPNNHFKEVLPLTPPANQIWYMTDDRKPLDRNNQSEFLDNNFNRVDTAQTYLRSMGKIFFDGPLDRIGVASFKGNQRITKIYLPDTALYIGQDAFRDCPKLRRVTLPNYDRAFDGTKTAAIGPNAFENCPELQKVRFGRGIAEIGTMAFASDTKLQSVKFPKSLQRIYPSAFRECSNLATITINATSMERLWSESFDKIADDAVFYVPYLNLSDYDALQSARGLNFQTKIPVSKIYGSISNIYCNHNMIVPSNARFGVYYYNPSCSEPDYLFQDDTYYSGYIAPAGGYEIELYSGSSTVETTSKDANYMCRNDLTGVLKPTSGQDLINAYPGCNIYRMKSYWYFTHRVTSADQINAYEALLIVNASGQALKFNYDEATGIGTLNADTDADTDSYNTAGQKVAEGYKGIVIKNGKKYLNK